MTGRSMLPERRKGLAIDYEVSPPEVTADAIVAEIDRVVDFRPVETDGAARAAELIAPLV